MASFSDIMTALQNGVTAINDISQRVGALEVGSQITNLATQTSTLATQTSTLATQVAALQASQLSVKFLQATRSMTAASGNVSYTGVGFTPSLIIAIAALQTTGPGASWGISDGTNETYLYQWSADKVVYSATGLLIYLSQSTSVLSQDATVLSLDADGFTLTWTRTGATTADTINIGFICLGLL